jgi:hypothetical protein
MAKCGHADYLRSLAVQCETRGAPPVFPGVILRKVAALIDAGHAFDDEPTDPMLALICPNCGQVRPPQWTPSPK